MSYKRVTETYNSCKLSLQNEASRLVGSRCWNLHMSEWLSWCKALSNSFLHTLSAADERERFYPFSFPVPPFKWLLEVCTFFITTDASLRSHRVTRWKNSGVSPNKMSTAAFGAVLCPVEATNKQTWRCEGPERFSSEWQSRICLRSHAFWKKFDGATISFRFHIARLISVFCRRKTVTGGVNLLDNSRLLKDGLVALWLERFKPCLLAKNISSSLTMTVSKCRSLNSYLE